MEVASRLLFGGQVRTWEEKFFYQAFKQAMVVDSVSILRSPVSGYGLVANKPIGPGDVLLQVPAHTWKPFSANYARQELSSYHQDTHEAAVALAQALLPNSPTQASRLVDSISMALLLMKKTDSEYVEFLKNSTFPHNIHATPTTLVMDSTHHIDNLLSGTKLQKDIMVRQRMYDRIALFMYEVVNPSQSTVTATGLIGLGNSSTSSSGSSSTKAARWVDEFKWAMGIILSRAISSGDALPFTITPVLDLANHGGADRNNAEYGFDDSNGCFTLKSSKYIPAQEEICISYGTGRDTNSFMTIYNFCGAESNANDTVELSYFIPVAAIRAVGPQNVMDVVRSLQQECQELDIRPFQNKNTGDLSLTLSPSIQKLLGIHHSGSNNTDPNSHLVRQSLETYEQLLYVSDYIDALLKKTGFSGAISSTTTSTSSFNISLNGGSRGSSYTVLQRAILKGLNERMSPDLCQAYGFKHTWSLQTDESIEKVLAENKGEAFWQHLQRFITQSGSSNIEQKMSPLSSSSFGCAPWLDRWRAQCAQVVAQELLTLLHLWNMSKAP